MGPRFPRLGAAAFAATYPLVRLAGALMRMHSPTGAYARERIASMRQKLARGETVYVLGIGPGGHNAGVGLVEASNARGIRLIANHEEERFRAEKHFQRYPDLSVQVLAAQMKRLGIEPAQIHAACASWDYPYWTSKAIESVAQELPGSLRLFTREASPQMNVHCVLDAFKAPRRLGRRLNADGSRMPVISLRHHDNHAWLSWGVSPFATVRRARDGAGDRRRRRRRRDLHLRRRARLAQDAVPERQHLGFAGDDVRHPELVAGRMAAPEQRRPVHGRGRVGRLEPAHEPLLRTSSATCSSSAATAGSSSTGRSPTGIAAAAWRRTRSGLPA